MQQQLPPSFEEIAARLNKKRNPVRADENAWINPVTGCVSSRPAARYEAMTKEEFERANKIVFDLTGRTLPGGKSYPPVPDAPERIDTWRDCSVMEPHPVYGPQFEVPKRVFFERKTGLDIVFEDHPCPDVKPVPVMVSTRELPVVQVAPDPSLIFSIVGQGGKCLCGSDFSCSFYLEGHKPHYTLVYGRPPHKCGSVVLDGQLKPLRDLCTRAFSKGAQFPLVCRKFTELYLRACFQQDYYCDWGARPRLTQVCVLEESDYLLPGSKRLAAFYKHAADRIEAMGDALPETDDIIWDRVFHRWPFAHCYFAEALVSRSSWPEGLPSPPPFPFEIRDVEYSVWRYLDVAREWCALPGVGVDLPSMEVVGRVSCVLAQSGCDLRVVSDGEATAYRRVMPMFRTGQCPARQRNARPLHMMELVIGTGSVSVPIDCPQTYRKIESMGEIPKRPAPLVFFQGPKVEHFGTAFPDGKWKLAGGNVPIFDSFCGSSAPYTWSYYAPSKNERELLELFVRLVFDLRVSEDLGRWALLLPWQTFGETISVARDFFSGTIVGRVSQRAFVCTVSDTHLWTRGSVAGGCIFGFYQSVPIPPGLMSGECRTTVFNLVSGLQLLTDVAAEEEPDYMVALDHHIRSSAGFDLP